MSHEWWVYCEVRDREEDECDKQCLDCHRVEKIRAILRWLDDIDEEDDK